MLVMLALLAQHMQREASEMLLMLLMLALVAQHVQKKTRIMLVMLALVGMCSKGEANDADDAGLVAKHA